MLITGNYRSYPAPGQSCLKRCFDDPALYYAQDIARTLPPDEPTEQQIFGQDVEDFLLNGKLTEVTLIPDEVLSASKSRSGKKWEAFRDAHAGQRLLKIHEYEALKGKLAQIARNVAQHETAYELLMNPRNRNSKGFPEKKVGIAWHYCELDLKSEIDILRVSCIEEGRIVDIKTAADVHPKKFSATISNYGYDVQGAAYQLAVEQEFGVLLPFDFVVIQNTPSYQVETYRLDEEFLELGRKKLTALCEFYRACKENNEWTSETHGRLHYIRPHRYAETQFEEWCA